jgi:hypothetical protein
MATAIATYGERNAQAPSQLNLFSFLVGKWKGHRTTGLPDGRHAQYEWTWIGRYILDGMAIVDELHASAPDGSQYLGVTLRHFDTRQDSWIVDFLNVSGSFVRRQVNARSGSVKQDGVTVVVISEDGQSRIRERYQVTDANHFTYSTEMSRDEGRTWDAPMYEMTLEKVE